MADTPNRGGIVMIEIIHYVNRWGKQEVAVVGIPGQYATPAGKQYARRYAAGELPPYYPVPAIPLAVKWYSKEVTHYETLCIVHRIHVDRWHAYVGWWAEEIIPAGEDEHPSDCTCEVCRAWGA